MRLFHTVFNCKVSVLSFLIFCALIVFYACTNSEDFANPLDPENLRTAGAPDGLTLYAGDKQVRVTWNDTGQEGIKAYRIYRRSTSGTDAAFELVGSVDAPVNEFIDTQNLENDRRDGSGRLLAYEYRITYIDVNGVETPDPTNPPVAGEEPLRIWKTAFAIPSVPPPAPTVTLGDPTDLTIKLFWEGYEFPYDFSIFRVYAALDPGNDKPLRFKLIAEPKRDQLYYFDHDFEADGTRKVYRIAGYRRVWRRSDHHDYCSRTESATRAPERCSGTVLATLPIQYKIRCSHLMDTEHGTRTLPDINSIPGDAAGNLLIRPAPGKKDRTWTIPGEDPILVGQSLLFKKYYITAFDDTPGPDGRRDESELVEARSQ